MSNKKKMQKSEFFDQTKRKNENKTQHQAGFLHDQFGLLSFLKDKKS